MMSLALVSLLSATFELFCSYAFLIVHPRLPVLFVCNSAFCRGVSSSATRSAPLPRGQPVITTKKMPQENNVLDFRPCRHAAQQAFGQGGTHCIRAPGRNHHAFLRPITSSPKYSFWYETSCLRRHTPSTSLPICSTCTRHSAHMCQSTCQSQRSTSHGTVRQCASSCAHACKWRLFQPQSAATPAAAATPGKATASPGRRAPP